MQLRNGSAYIPEMETKQFHGYFSVAMNFLPVYLHKWNVQNGLSILKIGIE